MTRVQQIIRLEGFSDLKKFVLDHERKVAELERQIQMVSDAGPRWQRRNFLTAVVEESAIPASIDDIENPNVITPGLGKARPLQFDGQKQPRSTETWTKQDPARGLQIFRNFTCEPLLENRLINVSKDYLSNEDVGWPITPGTIEKFQIDATITGNGVGLGKMYDCDGLLAKYTGGADVSLLLLNPCPTDIVVSGTLDVWASLDHCCNWVVNLICC